MRIFDARALRRQALPGAALAALLAPAALAAPVDAPAADAVSADDAGDDSAIVVTGSRRRDEDVQDVPIAMSVVSAAALERRGDFTLGQIQQQVPSLQVFSFNPRNTNINIRGLGSNVALTNDGLENGVGFYIDNVFYGRVGLSQFDLVDLESIEVLRGPQGTLFGKNTTSGVINITSRKPSFSPEASAQVDIGNYGSYQIRASASGPLVADKLAVRLSGALSENRGFLFNVTQNSRAQDYYNASLRGQVLFTPTPDVSLRIIGDFSRQRLNSVLNLLVGFSPTYADGTTIPNNFAIRAARFPGYKFPSFRPFDRLGEADSHYQANMKGYGVSGQLDWDLGGVALTAISAYRWWDWDPANDGDSTALPIVVKAQQANRQRQFSQELRISSKGNRRLDYVLGAYYFWQVVRGFGATGYGSAAALWNLPTVNQTIANLALNGFEANSTSDPRQRSFALFGQTDLHITPELTLTTGLRYTHEKKSGSFSQFWVKGADISALPAAQQTAIITIRSQFNPVTSYSTRFTDNSVSGLATLTYAFSPAVNLYGTYSRGNKSGGLNLTSLPASLSPANAQVRPEKVDNFEIGLKSRFLDRAVTFNAALFQTTIRDYQTAITEVVPGTVNTRQYIANIPKVRSRGGEADLVVRPAEGISFNASIAYADAKYLSYPNAPQAVERLNGPATQNLAGVQLPGVPKFSYNLGVDADQPLGDLGGREIVIYGHFDYSHRSSFNTTSNNSAAGTVPGFGLANARLGLKTADGLWDVAVFARNLFDKNYFLSLGVANTGLVTGQVGEPRVYGVTLRTRL